MPKGAGGVAQGVGPEFKQKKKKEEAGRERGAGDWEAAGKELPGWLVELKILHCCLMTEQGAKSQGVQATSSS
jgi:hypothetical protein